MILQQNLQIKVCFFCLLCLVIGCSQNQKNPTVQNEVNLHDSLESIVFNQVLSQLIPLDTNRAIMKYTFLVPLLEESKNEFENRLADSIALAKSKLKEVGFSVFIQDYLMKFPIEYLQSIDSSILLDSSYIKKQLMELEDLPMPKIKDYKAALLKKRPTPNSISTGYLGFAGFSRIAFEKSNTSAILYAFYDPSGSGLGGQGMLILLKKQKDKWLIETKIELWVS